MKYIKGTIGPLLILSTYNSDNIMCYVDTEFSVHKDMRSHTGGFMTMVTGGAYVQPIKQKENNNSSTEVEIFRVENVLT